MKVKSSICLILVLLITVGLALGAYYGFSFKGKQIIPGVSQLRMGLDIAGGVRLVYKPEGEDITTEGLNIAQMVLRNRLDVKGLNEVNNVEKLEIRKEAEPIVIFEFEDIDKASDATKNVKYYDYTSVFYKDEKGKKYYLVLSLEANADKERVVEFNKVCNTLAEYGTRIKGKTGMNHAYYEEHYKIIIKEDAVSKLSKL